MLSRLAGSALGLGRQDLDWRASGGKIFASPAEALQAPVLRCTLQSAEVRLPPQHKDLPGLRIFEVTHETSFISWMANA
jgi:hypothetical protein